MKKILVVEDDVMLQQAVLFKLNKEGFETILAGSGEEALERLAAGMPDLIWLDLLMPGMGGMKFLELLRQKPEYKTLPVIIVSVYNDPQRIQKAFELNVIDYFVKSETAFDDAIGKVKAYLK